MYFGAKQPTAKIYALTLIGRRTATQDGSLPMKNGKGSECSARPLTLEYSKICKFSTYEVSVFQNANPWSTQGAVSY